MQPQTLGGGLERLGTFIAVAMVGGAAALGYGAYRLSGGSKLAAAGGAVAFPVAWLGYARWRSRQRWAASQRSR